MALNIVKLGPEYIPLPTIGRAASGAKIYVGKPGLDPTIEANQKQLQVRKEDGTLVNVPQPITTGAGGVPVYTGQYVTLLVDGDYSLKIMSATDTQLYYVPKVDIDPPAEFLATTVTVTDDTTASALGYTRIFAFAGGSFDVAAGKTLTIDVPFDGDLSQHFSGDGTVIIKKGKSAAVFPQWWGAIPRDETKKTVNNAAVGAAATNARTEWIPLEFTDLFYVSTGFRYGGGMCIEGHGVTTGLIHSGDAGYTLYNTFSDTIDRYDITMRNFAIYGYNDGITAPLAGIYIDRIYQMLVDGIHVEGRYYEGFNGGGATSYETGGFTTAGILFGPYAGGHNSAVIRIVNGEVMDCIGDGIQINGGTGGALIQGNRIQANSGYGVRTTGSAVPDEIKIIANDIEGNVLGEVSTGYTINLSLLDNHIEHTGNTNVPVKIGHGSLTTSAIVRGNNVAANGATHAMSFAGSPADQLQQSVIDGNYCTNYTTSAFYFGSPVDCRLGPNTTLPGLPVYTSAFEQGLNYYETGTWTPALTFATTGDLAVTYSVQRGTYTRRGDRVLYEFAITTSTFTHATASGNLRITGLKHSGNVTSNLISFGTMRFQGITKAGYSHIVPTNSPGLNYLGLNASASGASNLAVTAADMPTGGTVVLNGQIEIML